ncbi:VgrG-related protein [Streptomyces hoynatensis]|uniref:Type IV secretion protein Rhs n=1 Tax=Streptomyces hoynatensis TaxID=1141874 RepID=A0A3A9YF63_9ACTN|nr:VgrG-related protein [Streptomyces hoynatensis]RKN35801.1 type IV secretion protein Rhs [Streptomyces hoynatensis]
MVNQSVAKTLLAEFDGRALPPALATTLVEAYVDGSRTLPDLFVLRFRDPDRVLLEQTGARIGTPVRLLAAVGDGAAPQPLMSGEITALEVEVDETGTFTLLRGFDESHRLLRGRRVAGYQNMTLADICTRVARRAGLQAGRMEVAGPVLEHVAQPNISDWQFLSALAQDAGAQIHVTQGRLHLVRPTEAAGAPDVSARAQREPLVLELGDNLLRCRAGVSAAEQVTAVEVRAWDMRIKREVVGRARVTAEGAPTQQAGLAPAEAAGVFGPPGFAVTDTPYGSQAEADQAATALAERIAGSFAELDAVIRGNPAVRAGVAVTLVGVGKPFEGRYTVTAARHVFDPVRGYETWVTVSGQQERSLSWLAGGGRGGAGAAAAAGCAGLVSAVVTDTKDPEGLGRVKVEFPWLADDYASAWARTAQAGGTSGGEVLFLPEVGEEVLVGFELGHLNRPYVLGGLFNGHDRPEQGPQGAAAVDATSGEVTKLALDSREGNRLELLDFPNGPQGVRLLTGDGKLTLALDRTETVIVVDSEGQVRIEAAEQISVTAGNGISVDAGRGGLELTGETVEVTARSGIRVNAGGGRLSLTTDAALEARGNQVSVQGATRTELKGGSNLSVKAPLVQIN